MREISVHEFRNHLREAVEEVVEDHLPLRMEQIERSLKTHKAEEW